MVSLTTYDPTDPIQWLTHAAQYVIWSNEHQMWWGPAERGYTPWLEEAGRYDLKAARRIVAKATLDGRLTVNRPSRLPSNYGVVHQVNEHLMLAPESLRELLDAGHA